MRSPSKSDGLRADNIHVFREPWLHGAVTALRPIYRAVEFDNAELSLTIPEKIRCAFGITSSGVKSKRKSECWPADASADGYIEIFISPDIAEPLEVLGHLTHALVHACLPNDAGHGPKFKDAAIRLGLVGKLREAMPGKKLNEALAQIAESLGPLPHASLSIQTATVLDRPKHEDDITSQTRPQPADKPKKQKARLIACRCQQENCMVIRMASKWLENPGPPTCPQHGPLIADAPNAVNGAAEEETQSEAA